MSEAAGSSTSSALRPARSPEPAPRPPELARADPATARPPAHARGRRRCPVADRACSRPQDRRTARQHRRPREGRGGCPCGRRRVARRAAADARAGVLRGCQLRARHRRRAVQARPVPRPGPRACAGLARRGERGRAGPAAGRLRPPRCDRVFQPGRARPRARPPLLLRLLPTSGAPRRAGRDARDVGERWSLPVRPCLHSAGVRVPPSSRPAAGGPRRRPARADPACRPHRPVPRDRPHPAARSRRGRSATAWPLTRPGQPCDTRHNGDRRPGDRERDHGCGPAAGDLEPRLQLRRHEVRRSAAVHERDHLRRRRDL
jgi:hypothetical protein